MAQDIDNSEGVDAADVVPGVLMTTGRLGMGVPLRAFNRPVYNENGVRLTNPDMIIPPGSRISFDRPATSATGGQATTGNQRPLDAQQIAESQARVILADKQHDENIRQFDAQYKLNQQQFGEQTAQRLLQQQLAQENQRYNNERLQLDKEGQAFDQKDRTVGRDLQRQDQEFDQRDRIAGRKMDWQQLLASRSGPQDMFAYLNLLQGQDAPTPQSTRTIDINSILGGLAPTTQSGPTQAPAGQPGNVQIGQPFPAQPGAIPVTGGGQPPTQAAPTGPGLGGGATLAPGGDLMDQYFGRNYQQIPIGGGEVVPPPIPDPPRIPRMEHGGTADDEQMIITGDSTDGKENEELVMVRDGKLIVIPLSKLPHAGSGGVYNAGLGGSTITQNTYSPQQIADTPFIQRFKNGATQAPVKGFGARIENQRYGIDDYPSLINLRAFGESAESEQLGLKSLYEQALGINFGDVMGRSRRLGFQGSTIPVTRYGG